MHKIALCMKTFRGRLSVYSNLIIFMLNKNTKKVEEMLIIS